MTRKPDILLPWRRVSDSSVDTMRIVRYDKRKMRGEGSLMNKNLREEWVRVFEDTRHLCETNGKMMESIRYSKKNQKVIADGTDFPVLPHGEGTPAKVLVSKKRSLEAAGQYRGRKVCVLNFASATNPGGGVTSGAGAQEEAICRCSTLYACISDKNITSRFHDRHRQGLKEGRLTALYNDDCIYTPDVMVVKTDTEIPKLMPEEQWYGIDVVTCAAPNLRRPADGSGGRQGNRAADIGLDELRELHKKRACRILDLARRNHVEVMILGAFGCGAFHNPPEVVAQAMLDAVREYLCDFSMVEFAVYCPPHAAENYDVFKRILAPICK